MAPTVTLKPIEDLAVRDQNENFSVPFALGPGQKFILAASNSLDTSADVKLYGGFEKDGTDWFLIGTALSVASGATAYMTWTEDWPWYKVSVTGTGAAAPTTGDITVYARGM